MSFEIRLGWGSISREQVTGCVLLFFTPFEVRTKQADFPVTVIIEVLFVYLRQRISLMCFPNFPFRLCYLMLVSLSTCYRLQ